MLLCEPNKLQDPSLEEARLLTLALQDEHNSLQEQWETTTHGVICEILHIIQADETIYENNKTLFLPIKQMQSLAKQLQKQKVTLGLLLLQCLFLKAKQG